MTSSLRVGTTMGSSGTITEIGAWVEADIGTGGGSVDAAGTTSCEFDRDIGATAVAESTGSPALTAITGAGTGGCGVCRSVAIAGFASLRCLVFERAASPAVDCSGDVTASGALRTVATSTVPPTPACRYAPAPTTTKVTVITARKMNFWSKARNDLCRSIVSCSATDSRGGTPIKSRSEGVCSEILSGSVDDADNSKPCPLTVSGRSSLSNSSLLMLGCTRAASSNAFRRAALASRAICSASADCFSAISRVDWRSLAFFSSMARCSVTFAACSWPFGFGVFEIASSSDRHVVRLIAEGVLRQNQLRDQPAQAPNATSHQIILQTCVSRSLTLPI